MPIIHHVPERGFHDWILQQQGRIWLCYQGICLLVVLVCFLYLLLKLETGARRQHPNEPGVVSHVVAIVLSSAPNIALNVFKSCTSLSLVKL